mmetsp:Transcript_8592/g.13196  ORF Transcript_8592/g.13196 Transcript_8592/m.13196 type:complete len:518 (+) Transcript_8592:122-1675(+)
MALETEIAVAETKLNPLAAMMGYPGLYWWQSSEDLQLEMDPSSQPASMWTQFAISAGIISNEYLQRESIKADDAESRLVENDDDSYKYKKKEMKYAPPPKLIPIGNSVAMSGEGKSIYNDSQQDEKKLAPQPLTTEAIPNKELKSSCTKADFLIHYLLGKGRFGEVMLATHIETKQKIALKILHKKLLLNSKMRERARNERFINGIFVKNKCPFVVLMSHAFATEKHLCLALQLLPCGDLFQLASKHTSGSFSGKTVGRKFPEKAVRFYLAECILALKFVHEQTVLYRDLKPENVLINYDGHIKISDFGLSKYNIRHPLKGASSMCGTPEYMAPEMLNETNNHQHGLAVDFWALGALFYELLDGHPPWYSKDRLKLFDKIIKTPFKLPKTKPKLSSDASSLLKALLEKNPSVRIGSSMNGTLDIQQHRFFSMVDFHALHQRKVQPPFLPTIDTIADFNQKNGITGVQGGGGVATKSISSTLDWSKIDAPDPPRKSDITNQRFDDIFKNWTFVSPSSS